MRKTRFLIIILSLFGVMMIPTATQATIITGCTFDKAVYIKGDLGNITATIYNDGDTKIRVTVLTADINYFYANGDTYMQTFYTDEILPYEIQQGQSDNLVIPFSLHSNIAPGYIEVLVKAQTEQWNNNSQIWFSSDHPNYRPTLYVESPYKQLYEDEQATNDLLQSQVEDEQATNDLLQSQVEDEQATNDLLRYQKQELEAVNSAVTNIMYILLMTTGAFVVVTIVLLFLNRKARSIPRPTA